MSVALRLAAAALPNILLIAGTKSTAHPRENIAGVGLLLSDADLVELDRIGR
ncbi:hypothetical protein [Micromonospora sp. DT31]|uniref:hypothetical protein n=1 Tax=Micromonospora sp. DT31 TaxID=3393434 RepID=UPI003CEB6FAA